MIPAGAAAPAEPVAPTPEPVRSRLALLAAGAAATVDGVSALDAGVTRTFSTPAARGRVDGVRCVAGPVGYELAVQLVARPVPLRALSDVVRSAVVASVASAGLQAELGRVDVHVSGLDATDPT